MDSQGAEEAAVTYRGTRSNMAERAVFRVVNSLEPRKLNPRNDLVNHSPDGLNWGYGGSGPAQLALALLADAAGDRVALAIYQQFKWEVVNGWKENEFSITTGEIQAWLTEKGIGPGTVRTIRDTEKVKALLKETLDRLRPAGKDSGEEPESRRMTEARIRLENAFFETALAAEALLRPEEEDGG